MQLLELARKHYLITSFGGAILALCGFIFFGAVADAIKGEPPVETTVPTEEWGLATVISTPLQIHFYPHKDFSPKNDMYQVTVEMNEPSNHPIATAYIHDPMIISHNGGLSWAHYSPTGWKAGDIVRIVSTNGKVPASYHHVYNPAQTFFITDYLGPPKK